MGILDHPVNEETSGVMLLLLLSHFSSVRLCVTPGVKRDELIKTFTEFKILS